jgi:hypothetical protein
MGLRDKIKDALHGDKEDDAYGNTQTTSSTHPTGSHTTSGTHPTGTHGSSTTHGTTGTHGVSGTHGTSGTHGASTTGTHGTSGTHGLSGSNTASGTHGLTGSHRDGTSGTHGLSGTNTASGTHGLSGSNTASGTHGLTGSHRDGVSSTHGLSGTHGKSGTHGLSDSNTTGTHGLSGTHGTSGTHGVSGTHNPPGSFPTDDFASQIDNRFADTTTGTTTGTTTNTTTGTGRDYQSGSHHNPLSSGVGHHHPTDSGVHFGDSRDNRLDDKHGVNTTGNRQDAPYWGSMGQDGSHTTTTDALHRKDLPLRPNEHPGTSSHIGTDRHDNLNRAPAASGGTYNTVAGAGSPDFDSSRMDNQNKHTLNAVGYQNNPSGIRGGSNLATDDGYDSRIRDRDLGRDTRGSGAGAGLTGAGLAGAGVAAGRGDDLHHRADADSRNMGLAPSDQYQAGGGVPQSSMLDPYQTGPNAGQAGHSSNLANRADPRFESDRSGLNTHTGPGAYGTSGTGYGASRTDGPHDSNVANKLDPRVDSDRDGSNALGGRQPGIGGNTSSHVGGNNTSSQGAFGMGPDHFGPGHSGAKVMHKCAGCGHDNDISQYFRKDATYRMG